MNETEALEAIAQFEWVFAKKYAKTSPHEYLVCQPWDKRRHFYLSLIEYIFTNGYTEYYYGKPFTVCMIGGRKYWSMAPNLEAVDDTYCILNRSMEDNTDTTYGYQKEK